MMPVDWRCARHPSATLHVKWAVDLSPAIVVVVCVAGDCGGEGGTLGKPTSRLGYAEAAKNALLARSASSSEALAELGDLSSEAEWDSSSRSTALAVAESSLSQTWSEGSVGVAGAAGVASETKLVAIAEGCDGAVAVADGEGRELGIARCEGG